MRRIAVIGAGTMGSRIAGCYARAGYPVSLYSRTEKTLERAHETIGDAPVLYTTSIDEAVKDAWYVVETVAEKKENKEEVYRYLDAILPEDVIISSNTSFMDIFSFMPAARRKYSCIVHWVAPADIIPLIEIVRGPETTDETFRKMIDFHRSCDKIPVCLNKYVPGFIFNRLQSAMNREILFLLSEGYCSVEDIDLTAKAALMPRGMALGVIQRMDFNGIDNVAHSLENKTYIPAGDPEPDNIVARLYRQGDFGVKSGKGFYDYSGMTYQKAQTMHDEQMEKSLALAKEFLSSPIGKSRDDLQ